MTDRKLRTAFACLMSTAALAVFLWPGAAAAQTVCGKHADIVKRLGGGHGEVPTAAGVAANGALVEVYVSAKGGWTIIFTKPGGRTCLMAVGQNWNRVLDPFNRPPKGSAL